MTGNQTLLDVSFPRHSIIPVFQHFLGRTFGYESDWNTKRILTFLDPQEIESDLRLGHAFRASFVSQRDLVLPLTQIQGGR